MNLHGGVQIAGRVVWGEELTYLHVEVDEAGDYWAMVFKTNKDEYERAVTSYIPTPSEPDFNIGVNVDARLDDDAVTEGELQELTKVVEEWVESREVLDVDAGSVRSDVPPPSEDEKNDAGSNSGPSAGQPHKDDGVNRDPQVDEDASASAADACGTIGRPSSAADVGAQVRPRGSSPCGGGDDAAPATARRSPGEGVGVGSRQSSGGALPQGSHPVERGGRPAAGGAGSAWAEHASPREGGDTPPRTSRTRGRGVGARPPPGGVAPPSGQPVPAASRVSTCAGAPTSGHPMRDAGRPSSGGGV